MDDQWSDDELQVDMASSEGEQDEPGHDGIPTMNLEKIKQMWEFHVASGADNLHLDHVSLVEKDSHDYLLKNNNSSNNSKQRTISALTLDCCTFNDQDSAVRMINLLKIVGPELSRLEICEDEEDSEGGSSVTSTGLALLPLLHDHFESSVITHLECRYTSTSGIRRLVNGTLTNIGSVLRDFLQHENCNITSLSFAFCDLGLEVWQSIASGMNAPSLKKLLLFGCRLTAEKVRLIVDGLIAGSGSIESFSLGQRLNAQALPALSDLLCHAPLLHDFNLNECSGLFDGVEEMLPSLAVDFVRGIREHPKLKRVDLGYCGTTPSLAARLFEALTCGTCVLEELVLDQHDRNEATDVTDALVQHLPRIRGLRSLGGSYNAEHPLFFQALRQNQSLTSLRGVAPLEWNASSDSGDPVAAIMSRNRALALLPRFFEHSRKLNVSNYLFCIERLMAENDPRYAAVDGPARLRCSKASAVYDFLVSTSEVVVGEDATERKRVRVE